MIDTIYDALYPFFEWAEGTAVASWILESLWLFPAIEAVHLLGFALMGGAILVTDLRHLGIVFTSQPVAVVAANTRRYLTIGLVVMIITGVLLFFSESLKLYFNMPFWRKMIAIAIAIPFTYTVHRKVTMADPEKVGPIWGRVVAIVSLLLWGTAAWGGRWIGFWG